MNTIFQTTSRTLALAALLGSVATQAQPPNQNVMDSRSGRPRVDMMTLVDPIEPYDTVWMEDMTLPEIRNALRSGKTTALVFAGGMEDNGPYVVVDQHGEIVRAQCELIARKLGDALCAPILHLAPGDPERAVKPGTIVLSSEVFKSVVRDVATSLKAQGFKKIYTMVDHGSAAKPMMEVSQALGEEWKSGSARIEYVKAYYNNAEIEKYVRDVLKVSETSEGYHDDYFTAAVSVAINPLSARMPQRIKANKTTLNGVQMAGPKAAEDGRKIMAFRTDMTVRAIKSLDKE